MEQEKVGAGLWIGQEICEEDEMDWMEEEVWEDMQEWKEVERLQERVSSQEEKEKKVEHLQMMPAVAQQDELQVIILRLAEWSSDMLHEKHCPKEVWHGTEDMMRWKEWEQKDMDQAWMEVCACEVE